MVARITSGATPVEALYYNKDKIGRGEGRFLAAFNTPMQVTDERYFDIREALHCFDPYLEANRRTKNPVFHASLNPVPEDRLTNDELRQIASAKIPLSRMISPQLYWVMTGNDFTLDINNSEDPKILCVGNNPDRQDIYSAALGLYNSGGGSFSSNGKGMSKYRSSVTCIGVLNAARKRPSPRSILSLL